VNDESTIQSFEPAEAPTQRHSRAPAARNGRAPVQTRLPRPVDVASVPEYTPEFRAHMRDMSRLLAELRRIRETAD
jgi:hypothetical protein